MTAPGGAQPRPLPRWQAAGVAIGAFVALLYVLEAVDWILGGRLDSLGVVPRTLAGLWGVLLAPLLHFGWAHLLANTLPLLVLGYVLALSGIGRALAVTAVVWVVGGAGVWLLGPSDTVIAGSSVLVFGWLAYLLARGVFTRHWLDILVGVAVLVVYGSLLWGLLPSSPHVSWRGHVCGAAGGLLAAWWLGRGPDAEPAAPRGRIEA